MNDKIKTQKLTKKDYAYILFGIWIGVSITAILIIILKTLGAI